MNPETLSKKERRELKRQERDAGQRKKMRASKLQKVVGIVVTVVLIGGGVWAGVRYVRSIPPTPEGDIISKTGLHWHPHLTIRTKGEDQKVPANIGINGVTMAPLHTHDAIGTIHMEMEGRLVTKDDTRIGKFFKIWGKQFNSSCIFDSCNGPDGNVKMLVNGEENTEFDNYPMKDGDKIEIRYE